MELCSVDEISVPHKRRNSSAVLAECGDELVLGLGLVGMNEVHELLVADVRQQRTVVQLLQLVPAHVGDYQAGLLHFADASGDKSQTVAFAELIALLEDHLHSQADTQERLLLGLLTDNGHQAGLLQHFHGSREGSHAGKNDLIGLTNGLFVLHKSAFQPQVVQGVLHTENISSAVVDYGYHHRTPFVERVLPSELSETAVFRACAAAL